MKLKLRHLEVMSGVLIAIFASELGRTDFQARAYAAQMPATSAAAFLDSIGVNTHVDQGYDPGSYVQPLRYTGIRQVRVGSRNIPGDVMIHQQTGVRFTVNGDGNLEGLLSAARTLAEAHALLALEGPNEPNNFPITYDGKRGGGPDRGTGCQWRSPKRHYTPRRRLTTCCTAIPFSAHQRLALKLTMSACSS